MGLLQMETVTDLEHRQPYLRDPLPLLRVSSGLHREWSKVTQGLEHKDVERCSPQMPWVREQRSQRRGAGAFSQQPAGEGPSGMRVARPGPRLRTHLSMSPAKDE